MDIDRREIADGANAADVAVVVDNRQTTDLVLSHQVCSFMRICLRRASDDGRRHAVTYGGVGFALRYAPQHDVTVSHHSDDLIVFTNWYRSAVHRFHGLSGLLDTVIRLNAAYVLGHQVPYLHGGISSPAYAGYLVMARQAHLQYALDRVPVHNRNQEAITSDVSTQGRRGLTRTYPTGR